MRKLLLALVFASSFASAQTTSSNILPANTGQNLGADGQRWNVYAQDLDINGFISGTVSWTGAQTFKSFNNVQMCDGFSGATASAKINACALALNALGGGVADARGLTGTQTLNSNIFAGVTVPVRVILGIATYNVSVTQSPAVEGTAFEGQYKRSGLTSSGTILNWTGSLGGTLIDSSGTSNFTLAGMHLYGGANGGTAWKLSGVAPNYWQHGRDLFINGFGNSTLGAMYFGVGLNFLSDSDFYSVQIGNTNIGMRGTIQDAFFYGLDIADSTVYGVQFEGNSYYVQYGGHFSGNRYDFGLTDSSTTVNTYGVWFENSTTGILLAPGAISDILVNFDGDHLSTSAVAGHMLDTTNITGVVNFRGNKITQQAGTSVTDINLAATLTDSERVGNKGATFVGSIPMLLPSSQIGSNANGQAVTNSSLSIFGGGATGTASLHLRVPNSVNSFGTSGVDSFISNQLYLNWQSALLFYTNSTNADAAATLKGTFDPLGSFGVGSNVLASADPFSVDQSGNVRIGGGATISKAEPLCSGAITPISVNATTCAEQTFTIAACSSLATTDTVLVNQSTGNISLAHPVGDWRVSSAGVLAHTYCNTTAGALTPTAQTISVWRFR